MARESFGRELRWDGSVPLRENVFHRPDHRRNGRGRVLVNRQLDPQFRGAGLQFHPAVAELNSMSQSVDENEKSTTQLFAWHGWALDLPARWNPVKLEGDET